MRGLIHAFGRVGEALQSDDANDDKQTGGQAAESGEADTVSPRRGLGTRLRSQRGATFALVLLAIMALISVLSPWLAPHDGDLIALSRAFEGPSPEHPLGLDDLGRDVLSRLMFATGLSLRAAATAVVVALVVGVPLGLVGGYFGGGIDLVFMRLNDAVMSVPALILAISIIGFIGPSITNAMVAIGIVYAPRFTRVVRASTLSVREETYIEAALAIGVSHFRIIYRHVVPNILSPLIVQTTLAMGLAMLAEASLSFLGLGAQPPDASLGLMLGRAFKFLDRAPFLVIMPGLVVMLLVLLFNTAGDGLRDSIGREERR